MSSMHYKADKQRRNSNICAASVWHWQNTLENKLLKQGTGRASVSVPVIIHAVCRENDSHIIHLQHNPYLFQSSSPFSFCSCCRSDKTSKGCFLIVTTPGSQWVEFRGIKENRNVKWNSLWTVVSPVKLSNFYGPLSNVNLSWWRRKLCVRILATRLAQRNKKVGLWLVCWSSPSHCSNVQSGVRVGCFRWLVPPACELVGDLRRCCAEKMYPGSLARFEKNPAYIGNIRYRNYQVYYDSYEHGLMYNFLMFPIH